MRKIMNISLSITCLFLLFSCGSGVKDQGSVSDISKAAFDSEITYLISLDEVTIGSGTYKVYEKETGKEISDTAIVNRGTVLQIVSTPAEGYALDTAYAAAEGRRGLNTEHSSPEEIYEFPVTSDMILGAAFIPEEQSSGYEVYSNIQYGETPEKYLIYDVYVPTGLKESALLPIAFIIHGGGWVSGDPTIMTQMARQIVRTGDYIVCALNYRFLGTVDGNEMPYTINRLIEDCYGGIAHFMNLDPEKFHADINRFVVTGDSAGGHLSASVGTMFDRIGTGGFEGNRFEYWPTGLKKKEVPRFKEQFIAGIKAMAPTYGVPNLLAVSRDFFPGDTRLSSSDLSLQKASPFYTAPEASVKVPCWQIRGTADPIITRESLRAFQDVLKNAGWENKDNQYIEVDGASHAFFDWKPNAATQTAYKEFGKPYLDMMIDFFNKYTD